MDNYMHHKKVKETWKALDAPWIGEPVIEPVKEVAEEPGRETGDSRKAEAGFAPNPI